MRHRALAVVFLFTVGGLSTLWSQVPRTLSYQGVLTDSLGVPRPNGTYTFTFRLYDAPTGGSPLWSEQKTLGVERGLFHTALGDQVLFGAGLTFDRPYWLSIQVAAGPELQPRVPLTPVGQSLFSLAADTSRHAIHADTAQYARLAPQQGFVDSARVAGTVGNGAITSLKIADSTIMGVDINHSAALNVRSITAMDSQMTIGFANNVGLFVAGPGIPRFTYAAIQAEQFGIAEAAWLHSANATAGYPVVKLLKHPSSTINFIEGRTSNEALLFQIDGSGGAWFSGIVGVGVLNPSYKLNVAGALNATTIYRNGAPIISSQWTTSGSSIYYNIGNVGIGVSNPSSRFQVTDGSGTPTNTSASVNIENFATGEAMWIRNASSSNTLPVAKLHKHPSSTANFIEGIAWDGVNAATREFHITSAGSYVAGSDFAEAFHAEGGKMLYEPGDVLVLTGDGNARVTKCVEPYDHAVVGVYSTRPGVLGADKNGVTRVDEDDIPVAITGIVPTKVTCENGSIHPGDLLTTSATPGRAMKATPRLIEGIEFYPPGTIVGKAIEGLNSGSGVIRILVGVK